MTDLNNTVLKAIVTTLQSKVDYLEAENKALHDYYSEAANKALPDYPRVVNDAWLALPPQSTTKTSPPRFTEPVGRAGLDPSIPGTDEDWNLYWKSAGALPGSDDYWMANELEHLDQENIVLQSDVMKLQDRIDALEQERAALIDKETIEHNTAHLWNERDLIEENSKLLKDNTKLATKVRRIESGHFDEFFTYTTSAIHLSPFGTATITIALTREADFYITKIVRIQNGPFAFLV